MNLENLNKDDLELYKNLESLYKNKDYRSMLGITLNLLHEKDTEESTRCICRHYLKLLHKVGIYT